MGRGKCLSEADVALIEDGVGTGESAKAIYDKHSNPGRGKAEKTWSYKTVMRPVQKITQWGACREKRGKIRKRPQENDACAERYRGGAERHAEIPQNVHQEISFAAQN